MSRISCRELGDRLTGWSNGDGPLYRRLASGLALAIERGELAADTLLPTERSLADALAVSRTTVAAAYRHAKDAGHLRARQGSGTWVAAARRAPANSADFAADVFNTLLNGPGPDLIDLAPACPLPTPVVIERLRALDGGALTAALAGNGYLPAGLPQLRAALAEWLTAKGLPTGPEQILVTTGAQQAIGLIARLLAAPGDAVVVEEATFPGALNIFASAELRPLAAALDEGGLMIDRLERLLSRTAPAFAYAIPSHQNPTGSVLGPNRRARLAGLSRRLDLPLIDDVSLQWLSFDGSSPRFLAEFEPTAPIVTVGSLSKTFWGGLRIGWVRAERPLIERLAQLKTVADLGSPVISQWLAAGLMDDFDLAIAQSRARLTATCEVMVAELARLLPSWRVATPAGGVCLWPQLPTGDARAFAQVAARYGVAVIPGPTLSAQGAHSDRLRLSLVQPPEIAAEAVDRLASAWAAYSRARRADDVGEPLIAGCLPV